MNYHALLERILNQVDAQAYLVDEDNVVDPVQAPAMRQIKDCLSQKPMVPDTVIALAHTLHNEGHIDRVNLLSALHVLYASPQVADYDQAARLVAEQEQAAIELGGPRLQSNLASVERHRGVLAFVQDRYDVALDYFSRAFERQHTAGNLANVLATLLRIGDVVEARDLYNQVCSTLHPTLVSKLRLMIETDPDLTLLQAEVTQ